MGEGFFYISQSADAFIISFEIPAYVTHVLLHSPAVVDRNPTFQVFSEFDWIWTEQTGQVWKHPE